MNDLISQIRNDHHGFTKDRLDSISFENPFDLFQVWFEEAAEKKQVEFNAMTISTVSLDSKPSSRIVYLKTYDLAGFQFFTNYNSQKGKELAANQNICASFFWPDLERQIRIEGQAEKMSAAENDAYFNSRPRGSQLGAWASYQSEVLSDRMELEQRLQDLELQFPDQVARPPHWGGYRIVPSLVEFWQGRSSRLHDRFIFEKEENSTWKIYRKNP